MTVHGWTIPGAQGQPILGNTHLPSPSTQPKGMLLICHGFKGFKDYGFLPFLARCAARRGLIAHRFNFSHSGMTEKLEVFERPDLFEQDTFSKQVFDLHSVARAAAAGRLPGGELNRLPSIWFGHSRGGIDVLLGASWLGDPSPSDLPPPVGLILAAAPHKAIWLEEESLRVLRRRGYVKSPSSRTGQMLRIGRQWLEEIEARPEDFDPLVAIARVRSPVLLVHGDTDGTVPLDSAHAYAAVAGDRAHLRIIVGGTHTFNGPHPLPPEDRLAPQTREAVEACCDFAEQLLSQR